MRRALDLFSGAGGCARGYQLAGYDVTGVDVRPQPRYAGDRFIQADAMDLLADAAFLSQFDLVHASPPCQGYSTTRTYNSHAIGTHPMLITDVRNALRSAGVPYVIENVMGARDAMESPVMLCGVMFGLRLYRHRLFESSHPITALAHAEHVWRPAFRGCMPTGTQFVNFDHFTGRGEYREMQHQAMGIDWMTNLELDQAIPPAYTRYLGLQMRNQIRERTSA